VGQRSVLGGKLPHDVLRTYAVDVPDDPGSRVFDRAQS
jgi:hypothetical protein